MKQFFIILILILSIIGVIFIVKPKTQGPAPQVSESPEQKKGNYTEIINPSGFVNTEGIALGDLIGKKVVMVDFMTYTCINCVRTFPYLNAWYDKYKDQGLEIVGIHTPEFAFEKKKENVVAAMEKYGIKFPIVLDNEYATWNAYQNRYWPRKYLIDINGNVVYDHIGEGGYEETEQKIQELLKERAEKLDVSFTPDTLLAPGVAAEKVVSVQSPETYFGSNRNESLGNGYPKAEVQNFVLPKVIGANRIYLEGQWVFDPEYAENKSANAKIVFKYNAQKVFLVMRADSKNSVTLLLDGKPVEGVITVDADAMYRLIEGTESGEHTLEIIIKDPGLQVYAFTFG